MNDQNYSRVENLKTAYGRAVMKDERVEGLVKERRFDDAENAEPARNAALAQFFRLFVQMVNSDPEIWSKLK